MGSFQHGSGRQSGRLNDKSTHPGLRERLVNRRGSILYIKNAVASTASFLFDLLLISLMIERWGWNKLLAVCVGFILANALHYLLARAWIFRGSLRGIASGYIYFLGNSLLGLGIILALFAFLADGLGVPYLIARVIASLCAGTIVFILNATINFRQL